ncbi:hypothetical protein OG883_41365 [Streptomyces sp. NBC_01142]|uniref:hypothetical protein n=1 Tax=Streptomyces sp. NBC_01142 TaxID=2975865 RepID=UPI002257E4BF|nr:hypothetical protein [Streptomyces sp. NBC_01142]MCX4826122.1 hypothetical protein [Streptomyces sp. NBC_01142]
MGDIAKGVLGGGWALLVGWILPTALNVAVFTLAVAPSLHRPTALDPLWPASNGPTALLLLVAAVLLGLVLNALQTPLYRVLEGYALWPTAAYERGCRVQRSRHQRTVDRLADPTFTSPIRRAILQEKFNRYPVSDKQITPTRLGNAIRRFEEYGYDRYRLDTQVLWNELASSAPEPTTKQVVTARTSVDFFVALLYGHAAVAVTAFASLSASHAHRPVLVITGVTLAVLTPAWYHGAVAATDEWAAAVRALVNLGRKPLADGLGLVLPKSLEDERRMWQLVTRISTKSYAPAADTAFEPYRIDPTQASGEPPRPIS